MVIAELDMGGEFYLSIVGGFALVACLLVSFLLSQPHAPHEHALARAPHIAATYNLLFVSQAVSVLLVGCGIKIALLRPGRKDAHLDMESTEQRVQLGSAVASAFLCEMLIYPLHTGWRAYYSPRRLRGHPRQALMIALRLGVIAIGIGLCYAPLAPYEFLPVQAALATVQCLLQQQQEHGNGDAHGFHDDHLEHDALPMVITKGNSASLVMTVTEDKGAAAGRRTTEVEP